MKCYRLFFLLLIAGLFFVGCNFPLEGPSTPQEEVAVQASETPAPTSFPLATYTPTVAPVPETTTTPVPEQEPPGAISVENFSLLQMTSFEQKDNLRGIAWMMNPVESIAFLSGSEVLIFNAADTSLMYQLEIPSDYYIFGISPIGNLIACTDDYQRVLLLSTIDLEQIAVVEPDTFVSSAHFNQQGTKILIASNDVMVAIEADALTGEIIKVHSGFSTAAPVYDVAFSRYTNDIIWISRGRIQVQNPISELLSTDFQHEDWVNSFAISPNGEFLAVGTAKSIAGGYSPGIQLWHIATGAELDFIQTDNIPASLFFSTDGTLLIGTDGISLKFWNTESRELVQELTGHIDSIYTASLSPSGNTILTASVDGQTILWHLP